MTTITLSMSALMSYMRCESRFKWEYILGIVDNKDESDALTKGTSFHKLMEYQAKGAPWPESDMIDVATAYLRHNPLPKNILSADDPHILDLSAQLGADVGLRSTFDLVYWIDKTLVIRDYKTFSKLPSMDKGINFQVCEYLWAASQIWPNFDNYMFEHVYVRSTPPNVPKDKAGNCWSLGECYPVSPPIIKTAEQLQRHGEMVIAWADRAYQRVISNAPYLKAGLNDFGFLGCEQCPTKAICNADEEGELTEQTLKIIGKVKDNIYNLHEVGTH